MVVDAAGRAYIGNFGFDPEVSQQPEGTSLVRVDPDGSTSVAADDLICRTIPWPGIRLRYGAVANVDTAYSHNHCISRDPLGRDP